MREWECCVCWKERGSEEEDKRQKEVQVREGEIKEDGSGEGGVRGSAVRVC